MFLDFLSFIKLISWAHGYEVKSSIETPYIALLLMSKIMFFSDTEMLYPFGNINGWRLSLSTKSYSFIWMTCLAKMPPSSLDQSLHLYWNEDSLFLFHTEWIKISGTKDREPLLKRFPNDLNAAILALVLRLKLESLFRAPYCPCQSQSKKLIAWIPLLMCLGIITAYPISSSQCVHVLAGSTNAQTQYSLNSIFNVVTRESLWIICNM